MASTWISRAATGSVTSSTTFTFSFWIKRGTLGSTQHFFIHENAGSHTQKLELHFQTDNTIRMGWYDGSSEYNYDTEMLFKDTSAWYNFVFRYDTTAGQASNRVRMYVNGEQISYLNANGSSPTYMTQNKAMNLGQKVMAHGRYQSGSPGNYLTGSLSHIHYCDGQSYAPTSFGETDSTTGEWKIKANPSLTYGNNGYFILKDGNSVTNQAGNSSGNFSVSGGTLTKTEDCPSNVFATLNPLDNYYANATFSYGNTRITTGSGREASVTATIPMFKGKYYWETKIVGSGAPFVGIQPIPSFGNTASPAPLQLNGYGLLETGKVETTNGSGGSIVLASYATYTTGDIIGTAVDLDSAQNKIYFYKNGTILGASGVNITSVGSTSQGMYLVGVGVIAGQDTLEVNFGNGYFGTTAVSSAGTNASGNGIFEYDVPTGYTALSTKGLNT
jgi:hypothetical protein